MSDSVPAPEQRLRDALLFVISVPPMLEDQMIDWLLERDEAAGFTSVAVSGHSSDPLHLTIAEKVSGRQRRLQFQVQIAASDLEAFTGGLTSEFAGTDLHYWVLPLLAAGSLHAVPRTSEPALA
ncbi:MAG: DUF3240 family protein [Gammaproteobacteria bacterium]